LTDKRLASASRKYPHDLLVSVIREQLEQERSSIIKGRSGTSLDVIVKAVLGRLDTMLQPSLRKVVNASGVILHTNLGRAPLSKEAMTAMEAASRGYANLEIDMETGSRGSRNVHVESLLTRGRCFWDSRRWRAAGK
jgi:L-seryl-tRNA(Ser) seleniumtransferase